MRKCAGVLLAALVASSAALANVSIKNGNFFVGYTDVEFPGGFELKIERVYNSKSPFLGMFGWGWGSEFEVKLALREDGTIIVHEYGGGAENIFRSAKADPSLLVKSVDAILEAAEKNHDIASDAEKQELKRTMLSDQDRRHDTWDTYVRLGLLRMPDPPVGLEFTSNQFSNQSIRCERDMYVRRFDTGRTEYFSIQGDLIRISDKNHNYISIEYSSGRLKSITDNFGRLLEISINARGRLEQVRDVQRNRVVTYKYNDRNELVYSKDVDQNEFNYEYDSAGRHNLTRIRYSDNTTMDIEYYGRDNHENVKSVKDRDGTKTSYEYDTLENKSHSIVQVSVADSHGKNLSRSSYEYTVGRDALGREYTAKIASTVDGDRTETEYDGESGLPLVIRHGKEETRFQYDDKRHVIRKETPEQVTEMTYDVQVNKVSQVRNYAPNQPSQAEWSKFRYDPKGNLLFAENSAGKTIKLEYDENGRISSMLLRDSSHIDFTYNKSSKPIEIALVAPDHSVEKIVVEYDEDDQIKKVESPDGRAVAMKVTTAFQELQDIIRPAGVNLTF